MKKYTLIVTIGSLLLCISHTNALRRNPTSTSMSAKEETELRQAVSDYKKNKLLRRYAEIIINTYANQYPNDPLVKAKINEKSRFDKSEGIKPTIDIQPAVQPTLAKKAPSIQTVVPAQPIIFKEAATPTPFEVIPAQPASLPQQTFTIPAPEQKFNQQVTAEEIKAEKARIHATVQAELAGARARGEIGTPASRAALRAQLAEAKARGEIGTPESKARMQAQIAEAKARGEMPQSSKQSLEQFYTKNILDRRAQQAGQ